MITRQGRVEVLNDEDCREFPWHPKPVLELSDSNAVQLNEGPCLVLFVGRNPGRSPRVGQTQRISHLGGCLSLQLLSVRNNAKPGPLSFPAALLLTPMIYSWLCPCGRGSGSWLCAFLPRLPAGKNRSGWSPPHNQTHCWKEACCSSCSCGLGSLGRRPHPHPSHRATSQARCPSQSPHSLFSGGLFCGAGRHQNIHSRLPVALWDDPCSFCKGATAGQAPPHLLPWDMLLSSNSK